MLSKNERERISALYESANWDAKTDSGKRNCIHNYFLKGREFPGWELLRSIPQQSLNGSRILTYLWQRTDGKEGSLIRADLIECNTWIDAQKIMLAMLADYQFPKLTETGSGSTNIQLGDIGYIVPTKTIISSIFSRANMVVRIHNEGKRKITVTDMATEIDGWFHDTLKVSDSGIVPEIEAFYPSSKTAKRNEQVALNIKAKDPIDRPVWYRVMVGHGTLELRKEQVYYSSEKTGETVITLFVVNENGMVARATTKIEID